MRIKRGKVKNQRSLGQSIEEVVKFQEKSKVNCIKSEKDFVTVALKYGQQIASQLEKCLSEVGKTSEDDLELAGRIYSILMDTNLDKLENCKNEFEFWYDWNQKFNS